MKNINDYLIESSNKKEKSKAHKSFQEYFDNFDFNLIPVSERNKDVEDYEDIAKTSKMATEASLEDDVIIESNNNGEIKSVSQIVEELKVKYNMKDYQFRVYNPFEVQIVTVDQIPNYLKNHNYETEDNLGYKYPHDFGGYVKQQYMPDALKDRVYYEPSKNGKEKNMVRKKDRFNQ